ncbi:hypothetical protein H6P81_017872 [Aristolochia fimbriata]|uniref:AT3G52170-like helix-turn-helix domain-containing protein n=1 Tax=Aristolochia fimbriata TaxID=158543 RepID=A0AAV7E082_ARIFI|nr:hypothetical protein H6P81_017872 [Aristolochia fimbriata]
MQAAAKRALFTPSNSAARFPDSVTAFDKISCATRGSNIWQHGRSFAATVPSDSSKLQDGHRRVSKEERQAMLKSFIDKYRASNEGRFPTISHAVKEVGGSYYVVRRILQEIEHSYKVLPAPKEDDLPVRKERGEHHSSEVKQQAQFLKIEKYDVKTVIVEEKKPLIVGEVEKMTEETVADHCIIARRDSFNEPIREGVEIPSGTGKTSCDYLLEKPKENSNYNPKQSAEISQDIKEVCSELWQSGVSMKSTETRKTSFISSKTSNITTAGWHKNQTELKTEADTRSREAENVPVGLHDSGGLHNSFTQKDGNGGSQSDKTWGEASPKLEHKEPTEKRSTVWGNLKSFADGLFSFWRKA